MLQLSAGEEGGAAVATMLDYIALEDRLTQRGWRDVGESPGNGENMKDRIFSIYRVLS